MGLLSTIGAASGRAFGFTRSAIAAATDSFFNRVTLLLPGNGTNGAQNNTFLDSSTNNFTITRNGNTTQGTFSPFSQTGWSNFFDGTDDYLAVADNAVLRPGTSNFTLEAWIWRNVSGAAHTIYAKGGASTGIVFQVTSTNVLRFTHTTTSISSTGTIAANTWTHVAVVREGTGTDQTKLYINGTQDGQGTVSTDFTQTEEARIGTNRGATEDFNGYISNLRFVKGTALYTGAFTPSTSSLTTTSQGATATEVELLTCQSNRFVDNSSNGFTLTITGTPSVQAFSPFAPTAAYTTTAVGGSGYFDGNDYLTVGGSSSLAFGTGDFSIEAFVYPTTSADVRKIYDARDGSTSYCPVLDIALDNTARFLVDATEVVFPTTIVIPVNAWTHILVSRVSGNLRLFINGVQDGSTVADSTNFANGTSRPIIGVRATGVTNDTFSGYISNLRVLKGSGFTSVTVPTAPLTAITNTSLLLNSTNAGITDAAAKNVLETVGGAQISTTQSKFGGSSILFDGTGDWLLMPHTVDQMFRTGEFTIEMWVYRNASGTYGLVGKGTATTGWLVSLNSSNQVVFTYGSTTITSTGTISSATWTYIAVVREGTGTNQTKIYINGVNDGAGTVSTDFNQTNSMYVGADRTGGNAFNGYIDDLRITRGVARTVTTTPTEAFLLR
jgi:hypothetical protein